MTIELACLLGWVGFVAGYMIMFSYDREFETTLGCVIASIGGAVGGFTLARILIDL